MTSFDLRNVSKLIRDFKLPLSEIGQSDLYRQFINCWPLFESKKAFFLGDSGYLAILLGYFCKTQAIILNLDPKLSPEISRWKRLLKLTNLIISGNVTLQSDLESLISISFV